MGDIVEALTLYPTFAYLGALILGLLVGSFLNVVIYRLPKMMEAEWREQCAEHGKKQDDAADDDERPGQLAPASAADYGSGHE